MNENDFLRWEEKLANNKLPKYEELPSLELYMDQVIVLMEEYLAAFVINPEDKIITPAMINNYVKHGILPAPIKKKYNRIHLVYLIIISLMKPVISINLIKDMIEAQLKEFKIEELLNVFTDKYLKHFEEIYSVPKENLKGQIKNKERTIQNIQLDLAISANIYKMLVDSISNVEEKEEKLEDNKKARKEEDGKKK